MTKPSTRTIAPRPQEDEAGRPPLAAHLPERRPRTRPKSHRGIPESDAAGRDQLAALLPRISVAALLVEVDAPTGFLDSLSHAGGKVTRSGELKRNLIYVLIAEATNMGLTAMAEACGVPYDVLAWTNEWHLREETLRTANTTIVNHHHGLPLSQVFGPARRGQQDAAEDSMIKCNL